LPSTHISHSLLHLVLLAPDVRFLFFQSSINIFCVTSTEPPNDCVSVSIVLVLRHGFSCKRCIFFKSANVRLCALHFQGKKTKENYLWTKKSTDNNAPPPGRRSGGRSIMQISNLMTSFNSWVVPIFSTKFAATEVDLSPCKLPLGVCGYPRQKDHHSFSM